MKTVIFIFNSTHSPLPYKRVREFISEGYKVESFAFDRGVPSKNDPQDFKLTVVGFSPELMPYAKRIPILIKGLKKIKKAIKKRDVFLYIWGLDIACLSRIYLRKPFIYEEADLVHTYFGNKLLRKTFEILDKLIVKKSLLSNFTSEGFVQYHYGGEAPQNTNVIPNKLSADIKKVPLLEGHLFNSNSIHIGFVGGFRFKSIYSFTKIFVDKYPQHIFHVFGMMDDVPESKELQNYPNFVYHGVFKNPQDLPFIYSHLDLVLCTYDIGYENVKYAEPNKIYEAVYFETPIIVSKGTFLSQKVERLGIGYSLDPFNKQEIYDFIESLDNKSIQEKKKNAELLGRDYAINDNKAFFKQLAKVLKDL